LPKLTPPPFYAPPARWNEKAKTSEFAPEWLDYFTKQSDFLGNALNFASNDGGATLTYTNATTLTLVPTSGGRIPVYSSGSISLIELPAAGVTLSNAGLSANTGYYVYARYTGTQIILEASLTGHANASGLEVMSSDISRSLVGMIYLNSSAQFADTNSFRGVASWFNTRARAVNAATAADVTINSSNPLVYSNLFASNVVILSWGQASFFSTSGIVAGTGGSFPCDARMQVSADASPFGLIGYAYLPSSGPVGGITTAACLELAEGAHTINISIGAYNGGAAASVKYLIGACGLSGMIFV
jgi:hypothetical protein